MKNDMRKKLELVWTHDYIKELPFFIKERGFMFSENNCKKDILITGINPSFRENNDSKNSGSFNFQNILLNEKWDVYWGQIKKMLYDKENFIDLRFQSSYLDIFYFREKKQILLKKEILTKSEGIQFIIEQLNLTQNIIENTIIPKVIIVKNKESAAYWGKFASNGIIWMGYELEFIEEKTWGQIYKIKGLISSKERIAPEIKNTNLKHSIIVFTNHISQYISKEKRPSAIQINKLLELYYNLKNNI